MTAALVPTAAETLFDFAALSATPASHDPFLHLIVPNFVRGAAVDRIDRDWPQIGKPGAFPASSLSLKSAAQDLVAALESDAFRDAISAKLGLDLSGLPTMITFRDRCRARDGQIHTDSKTKVVTVLLYLNKPTGGWQDQGGRLRLLRPKASKTTRPKSRPWTARCSPSNARATPGTAMRATRVRATFCR
jgi:hypothetical protein